MGGYDCIAAGIDRYSHMTGSYIPVFTFSLKLRKIFENETSAEVHYINRLSQTKIPSDALDTHWSCMQFRYTTM